MRSIRKEVENIILRDGFHNVTDIKLKNVADFYLEQKTQAEAEPATKKIISQSMASLTEKEREISGKLGREIIYCESFMEIFQNAQKNPNLKDFVLKLVDINKVFFEDENMEGNPRVFELIQFQDSENKFQGIEKAPHVLQTPQPEYLSPTPHEHSDEYYPPRKVSIEEIKEIIPKQTAVSSNNNRITQKEGPPVSKNLNSLKEYKYEQEMESPRKETKEISYNFNLPQDLKINKKPEYDYEDDFSHENIREEYPQLIGRTTPIGKQKKEQNVQVKQFTPVKEVIKTAEVESNNFVQDPKMEILIRENENLARDLENLESNKREIELKLRNQRERTKYDRNKSKISVLQNVNSNLKPYEGAGFYNILKTKDDNIEKLQSKISQLESEFKRFAYKGPSVENDPQNISRTSDDYRGFATPNAKSKNSAHRKSMHKSRLLESDKKDISSKYDSSGTIFVNQMFHNIKKVLDKPKIRHQKELAFDYYDL